MTTNFVIGIDLGRHNEPPSLAVVERRNYTPPPPIGIHITNAPAPTLPTYKCVNIGMFSPNTSNSDVAAAVQEMLRREPALKNGAQIVLNEGPVGPPVADLFRRTIDLRLWRIAITNGSKADRSSVPFNVPRRDLLYLLQTLLDEQRCTLVSGNRYADALVEQMKTVDIKPPTTNDELAWRDQKHDGLVFAVSMACWLFENMTLDRREAHSYSVSSW